jgi:hypothetical protein
MDAPGRPNAHPIPLAPLSLVLFSPEELMLLRASVGFHAKSLSDPLVRDRLYRLWCRLDARCQPEADSAAP